MMNQSERRALIELLLHTDPGHRTQGVALMSSLEPETAATIFEAPYVDKGRPSVSFLTGYLLNAELISAWSGHGDSPWPWTRDLTSLDLAGQFHLTDLNGLPALAALERLDLRSCVHLTDISGLECLTNLVWLRLASCRALADLAGLEHCTDLEELDLSACGKVVDLTPLAGLNRLQILNLSDCKEVKELGPLEGHPTLEQLNLRSTAVETFDVLLTCPNLKRVEMGYLFGDKEKAIAPLKERVEVITGY